MISSNPIIKSEIKEITSLIESSKVLFLQCYDIEFQLDYIIKAAAEQEGNGSPILLQAEIAFKSSSLFPFKLFFSSHPASKSNYEATQFFSDIVKDVTKSDTLANITKSLLSAENEQAKLITDEMNDLLVAVQKHSKEHAPIFIINSFCHIDENSKHLLTLMLLGKLNRSYPFLEHAKYIFVDYTFTNKEYQYLLQQEHKTYLLYKLKIEDVPGLLQSISSYEFTSEEREMLYKLSGGQFSKIEILCKYLSTSQSENIKYDTLKFKNFIFEILQKRLASIHNVNSDIKTILGVAAEIAEVVGRFEIEQLKKVLHNEDENNVEQAVQYSDQEYFTKTESAISYFTHQIILDFFLAQNKDNRINSNLKIEEAVKHFRPGDFLYRAEYLEKAKRNHEAAVLYVLQYVKESLHSAIPSEELAYRILKLSENEGCLFFEPFKRFFEAYTEMDYRSAHEILEKNTTISNSKLLLVKFYLMGLSIKKMGASGSLIEESVDLLEKVIAEENDEPYFSELAKSTLISLYTNYFGDKTHAKRFFQDLTYAYSKREEQDPDAKKGRYVLYRKAAAIFSPEIAINYTEQSVKYFQSTIHYSQYLMALNNHAANLLLLGKYAEASGYLVAALELVNAHAISKNIPVYILSNYIIALTMSSKGNAGVPVNILEKLMSNLDDYDIKIIPLINIGIHHGLKGNHELALASLRHAKQIAAPLCDDYYDYYIDSNMASLHFISGNYDLALSLYTTACSTPPRLISSSSRHLFDQRFKDGKMLFESRKAISFDRFQGSILSNVSKTDRGDFFSRGFLFSDIQYWSEA